MLEVYNRNPYELALLRTLLDPAALFERVVRDDRTGELVGPFPWQADALRSAR